MGLKEKTIKSIGWQAFEGFGSQLIKTGTTIVLARILFPEDFGLVAMAGVFIGFARTVNEIGLAPAIIQRKKIAEKHISSAFWLNLIEGVFIFLIMAAASGLIARFYNEPFLKSIIIVSSTAFIITSLGTIHRALLSKRMEFKRISIRDIVSNVAYAISTITMAALGYGVWSLVIGGLISIIVSNFSLWLILPWRPKLIFDWKSIRELMNFGSKILGAKIMNYIITHIDNLIIGRILGAAPLGLYSFAYRLATAPSSKVSDIISTVTFPAYSIIQSQKKRLANAFLKVSENITLITYPLLFGLFAVAPEFIKVIYSEKWSGAVIPLQILCLAGAMKIIGTTYSSVFLAKGRSDILFRVSFIRLLFTSIAVYLATKFFGLIGAAAAMGGMYFIFVPVLLTIATRMVNLKIIKYLQIISPYIVSSTLMAFIIFILRYLETNLFPVPDYVFLVISVILGAGIYIRLVYLWRRKSISNLFQIIKTLLKREGERKLILEDLRSMEPQIKKSYSGKIRAHALNYLTAYDKRFLKMIDLTVKAKPKGKKPKILDIGIQYGFYSIILKNRFGFDVYGTDLKESLPKQCLLPKNNNIPLKELDLMAEDKKIYPKGFFDIIILGEVVEHVPISPENIIKKIAPYLKKSGHLIITTPNISYLANIIYLFRGKNFLEKFKRTSHAQIDTRKHMREYTVNELVANLEKSHFKIEKIEMSSHKDYSRLPIWQKIVLCIFPRYQKYIMISAQKL